MTSTITAMHVKELAMSVSSGPMKLDTVNCIAANDKPHAIIAAGRLPTTSQTDLFIQHDFKLMGRRLNVNLNVDKSQDTDVVIPSGPYKGETMSRTRTAAVQQSGIRHFLVIRTSAFVIHCVHPRPA